MLHLLVRRLQQRSEVGKPKPGHFLVPSWISQERKMQEIKVKMPDFWPGHRKSLHKPLVQGHPATCLGSNANRWLHARCTAEDVRRLWTSGTPWCSKLGSRFHFHLFHFNQRSGRFHWIKVKVSQKLLRRPCQTRGQEITTTCGNGLPHVTCLYFQVVEVPSLITAPCNGCLQRMTRHLHCRYNISFCAKPLNCSDPRKHGKASRTQHSEAFWSILKDSEAPFKHSTLSPSESGPVEKDLLSSWA